MRNSETWKPSKFTFKNSRLVASRDPKEVAVGSRLITEIVAGAYGESLRVHAAGRLLDLGCGKVPLYAAYKDFISENICVDWGNTLHNNPYIDVEADLNSGLPFGAGEFDTIILSDVLEHVLNPGHLWHEMARVLARDGKIIMNVPFFYWLHEQPHDYYRYTEYALRNFVQIAGFRLIELRRLGGLPEICADIFGKVASRGGVIGRVLASSVQSAMLTLLRIKRVRDISKRSSRLFPIGYLLIASENLVN